MSVAEAAAAKGELAAGLAEGVNTLSRNQEVVFTKYVKTILPADGYVFWVKASILDTPPPVTSITVRGSLHYSTDQVQREDETFGLNKVVFTSLEFIEPFNEISSTILWVATFEDIRFAFNARRMYYKQADLHHYVGDAVYPALATQLIDDPADISTEQVVSNSLPIWLTLTGSGVLATPIPVYPSFLVSENIEPPYIAVHITPEGTQALATAPVIEPNSTHWQLASDRVRVTLYGLRNSQALDWFDYVLDFMGGGDALGLQNIPTVRDDKRTQSEMTVLAMKKTVEFQVSYYQNVARDIARQYILTCIPTITLGD